MTTYEERGRLMCWRFAVTRDDAGRHGLCSYYAENPPDGGLGWIGPQRRSNGSVYCDRHWAQVEAERAAEAIEAGGS